MKSSVRLYLWGFAAIALAGIVISYVAIIPGPHVSRLRLTVNFLSYFTILTNTMVVFVFAMPGLAPVSRAGLWLQRPTVRAAVLLYVVVTALVYAVVLRSVWKPTGWQSYGDQILHYVVPVLYLVDWLFRGRHGTLRWRDVPSWLIVPAVYSAYTLLHGYLSGFYPYPFVDVTEIGYGETFLNMATFAIGFLVLGLLIVLADRLSGRIRPTP